LTIVPSMSSTYFLMPFVSFDIVSSALNIHWCPLLPRFFFFQPSTPHGVSNVQFWCPCYCLLQFCHSLLALLSFCCSSPSFIILGVSSFLVLFSCVFVVGQPYGYPQTKRPH
jgi:hypothetical protein